MWMIYFFVTLFLINNLFILIFFFDLLECEKVEVDCFRNTTLLITCA